ncbi:MAG: hypothetical protein NC396_04215 [Bacteroides sp.]|nr:hypothetical protein [Bacteroides sp.]MCM1085564.1 hypothetical protein [Bacteroides sp.]
MKIRSFFRMLGTVALSGAVLGVILSSCRHEGKPMDIYGVWQEKDFVKYHFQLDSTTWDTIKHLSHSQHRLDIQCAQNIDSGDFTKGGEFYLTIASWHDSSYRDPERYLYSEYVKGTYLLDTKHRKIRLDGLYYTDEGFTTVATDSTYDHSVGSYKVYSDYYINDKFFTLSLDDSTRTDINTFFREYPHDDCL